VEVESAEGMPEGIVVWEVPAATYAVFPTTLTEIGATYERMYGQWLPASGYQRAPGPDIELYDENFNPDTPGSVFYLYVPVK
jgi:AraC family transcriptional regulator